MSSVAIIGGTGSQLFPVGAEAEEMVIPTRWGEPSAPVRRWQQHGHDVCFIRRHGLDGLIPPHKVNYRANIQALSDLQADYVIALNTVGGIAPDAKPGSLVFPAQLIDYTWGREHTFYDGSDAPEFVDFTVPFDPGLRTRLVAAADGVCVAEGVYGVTQGPRLETAAEIDAMEQAGCTVVGMTAMPEAGLAKEAGLAYASCCHVVNYAAGRSETDIHAEIQANVEAGYSVIVGVVERFLKSL